jgi:hypothetical protein
MCAVVGFLCCLAPRESLADALTIDVMNVQYTTFVRTYVRDLDSATETTTTRTVASSSPHSDALYVDATDWASADADLFALATDTVALPPIPVTESVQSYASAEMVMQFSPVQDGVATLDFDFTGLNSWQYSSGLVSLLDLTTNQTFWSYEWSQFLHGTVPWDSHINIATAAFSLDQVFSAADVYVLTMYLQSDANFDQEHMTMQVSGLRTVPEPSSLVLVTIGLIGASWRRRRTC